ncbi:hypothetical protein [Sphingomicrobium nitratireducens]|uniref:hypothetical protein n=1 Tax=Sphingomicrobium nitratireducens TaxID=2964666 RepID=UPI0022408078|nr:hypothetical protein [Sphingomicrobium nitratireducens]
MKKENGRQPLAQASNEDADARPALFVPVGENPVHLFGQHAATRAYRLAAAAGMDPGRADRLSDEGGRSVVLADMDFVWDPAWLPILLEQRGRVLVANERIVLAHCTRPAEREAVMTAMAQDRLVPDLGMDILTPADHPRRFVMPLEEEERIAAGKAAFVAGCDPVTDVVTNLLRAGPAFHLARWSAIAGIGPAGMTLIGLALAALAALFFWEGWFGAGLLFGVLSGIAATAGRGLVRVIGRPAPWRALHGMLSGLLVPALWWIGWAHGLADGTFEPVYLSGLVLVTAGGQVADSAARLWFRTRFGFPLRRWRPIDGTVRLVAAGRNVGLLILAAGWLVGLPAHAFESLALWTLVSLIVTAVRLTQAEGRSLRGQKLESWIR